MRLFYGSENLVVKPEYGKGSSSNDYGLGFYLTDEINMARLWATRFKNGGYCITYEVDSADFNILKLDGDSDEDVLRWISILVKHRFSRSDYEANRNVIDFLSSEYKTETDVYDMIIGYRADDSYFAYSLDFVENELSLELLGNAMKIGKLGKQYVLKSKKAFNKVKMISYEKVEPSSAYDEFRKKALDEYHKLKRDDNINNTYIRDLMRQK